MNLMWKDVSSYSRSDKDRRPQTWMAKADDVSITVTRSIYCEPDEWLLMCDPWFPHRVLKAKEVDTAKSEAIELVRIKLRDALLLLGEG